MPEKINEKTIFSLSEVALSIQRTLWDRYSTAFWVKAEISKLNRYPHSGHCYPDLVEKVNGKIVAEMRSNIWKDDFTAINGRFLDILHEPLKDGITVLLAARVNFHPVYGLSLRIVDIDPSYSLGELEREKQETIRKLKQEGIFDSNRQLELPVLPQRIAIVSVQTSKGYSDFLNILDGNPWGYKFFHMLFPALLQGDQAVTSIMAQLDRIKKVISHFDAVAVIRGGGGDIGLTCYNNLDLVRRLALFPIPVLTGIGHSTNETVAEMVAMKNAITPTELADFLIQRFHNFLVPVNKAEELIVQASGEITASAQRALMQQVMSFRQATLTSIERRKFKVHRLTGMLARLADQFHSVAGNELKSMHTNLNSSIQQYHQQRRVQLEHMEKIVELLDPLQVLKRGYTLSVVNNKIVRSVTDVIPGEPLVTLFSDGRVISDVREIEKN